jgi:hypothetical protein
VSTINPLPITLFHLLFVPDQQLLETTLDRIQLTIPPLRWGVFVLFFGGVDLPGKARFINAHVTFHEDKDRHELFYGALERVPEVQHQRWLTRHR